MVQAIAAASSGVILAKNLDKVAGVILLLSSVCKGVFPLWLASESEFKLLIIVEVSMSYLIFDEKPAVPAKAD